jgi:ATP-binding cassette subfamily B protein
VTFYLDIVSAHRLKALSVIVMTIFIEVGISYSAVIIGQIIDTATSAGSLITSSIVTTIGGLLVLYLLIFRFGTVVLIRLQMHVIVILNKVLRTQSLVRIFKHLSQHSSDYFAGRFAGSISSNAKVVSENMVRLNYFALGDLLGVFAQIIATLIILLSADYRLGLFFVTGICLLIPINVWLTRKTKALSAASVGALTTLHGRVVDAISGMSAVQQFARQAFEQSQLETYINDYRDKSLAADIYTNKVIFVNNILVIVVFMGAMLGGVFWLWSTGVLSLGQFIMVLTLLGTLIRALSQIGNSINSFVSMYAETDKALGQIFIPHEIVDTIDAQQLTVLHGAISLTDVSFSYDKNTPVFHRLSLSITPGQKVGIVGPSGGGKTTLTKLLMRQYDIHAGMIAIDGHDIAAVTSESLREHIGVVPQEPLLFHRTIAENIRYGKLEATDEELIAVAQKAYIHDFIKELPLGYDTLVGERGVKLSGGQRQRIAIARTMLKDAPILVLDEATSALDSESELYIQKAFTTLMVGKTVLAIAHRLSTLQEMDRIIVVANGLLVQDGSHTELLADPEGMYARLWNHQVGGFVRDEPEGE